MSNQTDLQVREKQQIDERNGESTWEGRFYRPDVDIYGDDDNIVMLMDLPGASREGLDIDLRERILTLTARVDPVPPELEPLSTEFWVGGYQRRFTLTDDIDQDNIEAKLSDGVLMLVLPRAEHARPRKIEVRAG